MSALTDDDIRWALAMADVTNAIRKLPPKERLELIRNIPICHGCGVDSDTSLCEICEAHS
jgi:hypothetical protein